MRTSCRGWLQLKTSMKETSLRWCFLVCKAVWCHFAPHRKCVCTVYAHFPSSNLRGQNSIKWNVSWHICKGKKDILELRCWRVENKNFPFQISYPDSLAYGHIQVRATCGLILIKCSCRQRVLQFEPLMMTLCKHSFFMQKHRYSMIGLLLSNIIILLHFFCSLSMQN